MTLDPAAGFESRRANLADADEIAHLHVSSWRAAYSGIVAQEYLDGLDVNAHKERLLAHLHAPETTIYVVTNLDRIVGFATVGPATDEDLRRTYELHAMYIHEQVWGSGAGRAILKHVLAAHADKDLSLWVLQQNERAQHFYRRNGFLADGTERTHLIGEQAHSLVRYIRKH